MNVWTLWLIWIIVVIVVFIILIIPQLFGLNFAIALFIALLIGAIVVFVLAFGINLSTLSTSDRTWLAILLFVAYILPLLVALIVFIVWGYTMRSARCKKPCDPCEIKDPCMDPCEKKAKEKECHEKQKLKECDELKMKHMKGKDFHGNHHGLHKGFENMTDSDVKYKKVIACSTETGECVPVAETIKAGNKKATVLYA